MTPLRSSTSATILAIALLGFTGPAHAREPQARVTALEPVHANVCHLDVERSRRSFSTSSAVLFEGRYLLTAGHNLLQEWTRIRSIGVRCNVMHAGTTPVQQKVEPWQTIKSSRFTWWRGHPNRHDIGVIRLAEPIATTEPVTLAAAPATAGEQVCLYGYPGERYDGRTLYQGCSRVTGPAFFEGGTAYDIETFKSNSGGPVLRRSPDGKLELIAIHIQPGSGRSVDETYRTEVRRLIAELDRRAAQTSR